MVGSGYRRKRFRSNGFSLLEVIVSTVIVAMLIIPTLSMLGAISMSYHLQSQRAIASAIAQNLLTEIVQTDYEDAISPVFGPEPGELNRSLFDDIDDYHGWQELPPLDTQMQPILNAAGLEVDVSIAFLSPGNPSSLVDRDMGIKRILVTVDGNGLETPVTCVAIRARNGMYEVRPQVQSTVIRKIELSAGSGQRLPVKSGVNIMKQHSRQLP